jgi:hypothetical protein
VIAIEFEWYKGEILLILIQSRIGKRRAFGKAYRGYSTSCLNFEYYRTIRLAIRDVGYFQINS